MRAQETEDSPVVAFLLAAAVVAVIVVLSVDKPAAEARYAPIRCGAEVCTEG